MTFGGIFTHERSIIRAGSTLPLRSELVVAIGLRCCMVDILLAASSGG
jgi:hypothetical protein